MRKVLSLSHSRNQDQAFLAMLHLCQEAHPDKHQISILLPYVLCSNVFLYCWYNVKHIGIISRQPSLSLFFFFLPSQAAYRILVPWPGIKFKPSTVRAWSPNHWTTRVFPRQPSFMASASDSLNDFGKMLPHFWPQFLHLWNGNVSS